MPYIVKEPSMNRVFLLFLLCASSAYATKVTERSLAELVADADHIVVGTVTTVKMHTWFGFETTNPKSRTGPGNSNELRWTVTLDSSRVLKTSKEKLPTEITIKLWKMWHMSLEGAKSHEGKTYIFLLKGEDMQWVYPANFYRELDEMDEIKALLKTPASTKP